MKTTDSLITLTLLAAFLISFPTCATNKHSLKIVKGLPEDRLAYYNDSFDRFREDIWEKAALTWGREQLANYTLADISVERGELTIKTKTGGFSQGGLGSKYFLRGNFDIQLDCHINFLKGKQDIDQYLFLFVRGKKGDGKEERSVTYIGVVKKAGHGKGVVFSRQRIKGERFPASKGPRIGKFHGSLRIVRIGSKMSAQYRMKGEELWRELSNFFFPSDDVRLGFSLQNFISKRTFVTASSSVIARFDNFKINAAQEIIEEEI